MTRRQRCGDDDGDGGGGDADGEGDVNDDAHDGDDTDRHGTATTTVRTITCNIVPNLLSSSAHVPLMIRVRGIVAHSPYSTHSLIPHACKA